MIAEKAKSFIQKQGTLLLEKKCVEGSDEGVRS